jgi:hypothetical protein
VYSGDDGNEPATSGCGAANEVVTITAGPAPTIATQASSGGVLGTPVRDVATLAGGSNPTGTVSFRLFADAACASEVFTSTDPVAGGSAASDWFSPQATGTYRWTAAYSGDANNGPVMSPCNATGESVTITAFAAPPPTQTVSGDVSGPLTVGAGQSLVVTNARGVGPITVQPGGSLTVISSQISRGITADAPAFLSLCGVSVSGPPAGVALRVSNASALRIGDPAAGCAGNRFGGQVTLTGNRTLTFGANAVSTDATINGNGPGNSVVKANNVVGTLACAGNAPPPTNGGQVNTSGAKTGQCTAL